LPENESLEHRNFTVDLRFASTYVDYCITDEPFLVECVVKMEDGAASTTILLGDFDDNHEKSVHKADESIRRGFLRKVLGLLAVQLTFTATVDACFFYFPGLSALVRNWEWMFNVGVVVSIILLIAMHAYRRRYPHNFVLMFFWTLSQAYTTGCIVSMYEAPVVMETFFLTACAVVGLFVFTLQSRYAVSIRGSCLFVLLCILLVGNIVQLFLQLASLELILGLAGAALFSLFIVYDLNLLMHKLSAEEYIVATINLYLDILNLFVSLLRIMQQLRSSQ
ncbi:hypothetical protein M513_03277, partial [Trichuris suis]